MRIFNRSAAEHYGQKHATAREALRGWYGVASNANWTSPEDVKQQFPKASVIANNRIVFNIMGGTYREIVSFNYRFGAGYIKFFGTHAEYDRVNAETADHTGVQHGKTKR